MNRLVTSVSSNTELFLEYAFKPLPDVVNRSEFPPAVDIHMPLWINMRLVFVIVLYSFDFS